MRSVASKLLNGVLLVLGVTFISFLLMVWFGPDQTYTLIGKNASPGQIEDVRRQLGYDQPFWQRYGEYLRELVTLDLGASNASGEPVRSLLARTAPVSRTSCPTRLLIKVDFPTPEDGLRSMAAVYASVASAKESGAWVDARPPMLR